MAFRQLEIWVEELSMKVFLKQTLPKVLPEGFVVDENCFVRSHDGKHDLLKGIPDKAKANCLRANDILVLIIIDQDRNDCKTLKDKISKLVLQNCPNLNFLVRIACKELENWYLGDISALGKAYPGFSPKKYINKSKYRNPDNLNGSGEVKKLIPGFQKISGAREVSKHIDIDNNRSRSFNHFISGLSKLLA